MCLIVLMLLALCLGGAVHGCHEIAISVQNPEPMRMTCAELEEKPPLDRWVEVSGCHLALAESCREVASITNRKTGAITTGEPVYFVPVQPTRTAGASSIEVVLRDDSRATRELMRPLLEGSERSKLEYALEHIRELTPVTTVSGIVRWGRDEKGFPIRELKEFGDRLAPHVVLIERRAAPSFTMGIFWLLVSAMSGAALYGVLVLRAHARRVGADAGRRLAESMFGKPAGS